MLHYMLMAIMTVTTALMLAGDVAVDWIACWRALEQFGTTDSANGHISRASACRSMRSILL